ncbi:amidohydrolase [Romboutsia sp. CE17]|uniref:M20 metallopeptidase family protein n=1 Tax=Romboutsia sp. CE17 TaxID=2724150 RepID=UPI001442C8AD|nr:M20 family metallopeptidase [Romboutsia sp. CE17]QJA07825.1 amidohydrolase [Romboutsia sp. CE17]
MKINIDGIREKSNNIKEWLIDVRRDLHKTPELAMSEYETKEKIKKYLNEIGINYNEFNDNCGIVAHIIKPKSKLTIAIRADMDALPIEEKNNISYKSINKGIMHACGHDAHTAILLGACKLLYEIKDKLNINIKFIFQPAEETIGGARFLIKENCLENPKVDYIFGLHVQSYLKTSFIECRYNTINASANSIKIKVKGKKSHGAYPEKGVDALVASAQIITSLQSIISRDLSPSNLAVITLGKITGGEAQNIICEDVEIEGTIRAITMKDRDFVIKRVKEIVENTAKAYRCEGIFEVDENWYPPVINDKELVNVVKENAENLLGKDNFIIKELPSMGGEDFSFYTQSCKGVFFHLGCGNKEKKITSPLHTSYFDIDEDCLTIGVMMHLMNVMYFN